MTVNLVLLVVMGVLYAVGVYLLLERSLTRVLLGLLLLTNATNVLLILTGGPAGLAPLWDPSVSPEQYSDPLPQAFILTSIVISLALTALILSLIYRRWLLARGDEIQDDIEDKRVAKQRPWEKEDSH